MAKMYPERISNEIQSNAERKLFDLLKNKLSDEWAVLHSLGLAMHRTKPWAELDFVLIGPTGIFCIEVKGGRVRRENGKWHFTNRYGQTTVKAQGPYEQVGSASAALRNYLRDKFRPIQDQEWVVGYGVLFPDIIFKTEGPDIEKAITYDQRDNSNIVGYVKHLKDYWYKRLDNGTRIFRSLNSTDVTALVNELRGDFDLRPSLKRVIGDVKEELLRLTGEQYSVLDGLEENPRALILGTAGSGKTFLAVEEACRRAEQGDKVFLCCFNKPLANFLGRLLQAKSNITVKYLHGYMAEAVKAAGLESKLKDYDKSQLFDVAYPTLCIAALGKLNMLEEFDVLIVDEAQDLMQTAYLDVFDVVLKGSLTNGNWRFFYDPNQDLFSGLTPAGLNKMKFLKPASYKLNINCRNTKPVAVSVALLSGMDTILTRTAEGPEVNYVWYQDEAHQIREISKLLNQLLSEKMAPEDIIILSQRKLENSSLRNGLKDIPFRIVAVEDPSTAPVPNIIRYATIQSFKGLEADAVLLIDIGNVGTPDACSHIYVGASRAKAFLAVFINESQRLQYSQMATHYGQRLDQVSHRSYSGHRFY